MNFVVEDFDVPVLPGARGELSGELKASKSLFFVTMQTKAGQRKKNGTLCIAQLCLVQLVFLCLAVHVSCAFGLDFNVTLSSLTNHNTSANSAYNQAGYAANFGTTSWINQNGTTMAIDPAKLDESLNPITPGHVSHTDVHTLIPSRPDLRWFANGTCWFGESSHINIGVNNNTAAYAAAMVSDMESRGFTGMIFSWYGKGDQSDNVALKVQSYLASASNTNKNFRFIIMAVFGDFHGGESVTNLQANINYCKTQYFSDPNYETDNGHPILMFFNVRSSTYMSATDMANIKAATDPDALWVDEHTGHITESWVDMTYQWTDDFPTGVSATDPYNLNAVTNEFATIQSHRTQQAFGAMCAHFNGTLTKSVAWSEGKYLPGSNGLCEVTRAAVINSMIPTNMTRMQWATWSDWEEGTEVESGSENNATLTTQMSTTNVLSWALASGDERTIDHYDVYAATNGGNAAFLARVPTGIHQTNVSQFGLSAGIYQLYVNAVAKPCIRDHLSPPVAYVISGAPLVTFDLQPLFQTAWLGDPVPFSVTAVGVAPLTYQWSVNGQNIPTATNAACAFTAIAGTNDYAVTISNSLGSVSSSTAVVVGVAHIFLNTSNYYGLQITFGGYTNGVSLPNFPVLVRLSTNLPGFSYAQFISPNSGADLRFTDKSGEEIPFQIDQWTPSGESQVWVQVPSLTSNTDFITAHWGNPADATLQPCNTNGATWIPMNGVNLFLLVYHLGQTGFPFADGTLQYPASSTSIPSITNGMVGSGGYFSRTPYLDAGPVNLGNAFTLSAWANVSSGVADIQCVWANGSGVANSAQVFFYVNDYKTSDGALIFTTGDGGASQDQIKAPAGTISLNQWHLLTATVDRAGGTADLYVDGNLVAAGPAMNDFPTNTDVNLGRDTGGSFAFLGSLDESRIHSGIESSNWVWASYMTVAANSVFENYSTVSVPAIRLDILNSGGKMILTWLTGQLQSAPQLSGPYANVPGATSPCTNAVSGTQQFFRVKVQ